MKAFQEGDMIFIKPGDEFILLTEENLGLVFNYREKDRLSYHKVEIGYEENEGSNVKPTEDSVEVTERLLPQTSGSSIQIGDMTIDFIHCASAPHLCTESDLVTGDPDYYKLIFSDIRSMMSDYVKGQR